jgi:hypothetical protein
MISAAIKTITITTSASSSKHQVISAAMTATSASIAHMSASAITSARSEEHQVTTGAIKTTINSFGRFSAALIGSEGKKIDSDNAVFCREGQKIEAGDSIFEGDVGLSKVDLYFKCKNMRCRKFTEQYYDAGIVKKYHGVICQPKANEPHWTVMDKW